MPNLKVRFFGLLIFLSISTLLVAQQVVSIPKMEAPASVKWENGEKQYYSDIWFTEVVSNVSDPSLTIYKADPAIATGTSVIICPGGGLYALSITSEGHQVAKWLNEKGITAFVLKYRLVPTGEDAVKDISIDGLTDPGIVGKKVAPVLPLSVNDALEAIKYVRSNATELGVSPDKIGLMGFSAGGAVTMGATYSYEKMNRPDFIAPIYAWMEVVEASDPPNDAPPVFLVCATDDPLGLAPASVKLYSEWIEAKKPAEMHLYAKGGHGFGMRKQNLPSDQWINRFYEWLGTQGF